jgi:signal transduction histidine kinase
MVSEMKSAYPPIVLVDNNNKILQKYYFYHSPLVDKFRSLPYLAFIVFLTVVAIGYVAFNASRRNEESKVWVGMAKEAAHQLGTPLSSLLAWLEILKMKSEDDYSQEIVKEMENDILRLNIVATRFSKIGSKADLTKTNIRELIEEISTYFEKRLPHLGRKIQIIREINQDYFCKLNTDLFSWVFENLFKNAAEAIEEKQGTIYITINKRGNSIRIYIRDTGKGMSKKVRRNIFSPGFTTKKRGWGLGLSLTKKIVEDYHKGKIWVKDSMPGKGSTFVIELPLEIN